jgi:hypothetical protein
LVTKPTRHSVWIIFGAVVALLVYMAKMGNEGAARLLTPYYPLLIIGFLIIVALDGFIIRYYICKIVAWAVMLCAITLVVISPARPLLPANIIVYYFAKVTPYLGARLERVYGVYTYRYDDMKDLRVFIPEGERAVGFLSGVDAPEAALWRPYGSRQVINVTPDENNRELEIHHIHFVIVSEDALEYLYNLRIEELTKKWSAVVVVKKDLILKAQRGPETWYVIEL